MRKTFSNIRNDIHNLINLKYLSQLLNVLWKLSVIILAAGCNYCDNGVCTDCGKNKVRIYFTTKSLNGEIPSIYSLLPDGSELREIVNNGVIYSRPSKIGTISFIRNQRSGATSLYLSDYDGANMREVLHTDLYLKSITYPVLSPDGNWIAFNEGNKIIDVIEKQGGFVNRLSSNFKDKTLPSFSPDSRYIAFFEAFPDVEGFNIKVMNHTNNDVVFTKTFPQVSSESQWEVTIDWSDDGKYITYSVATDSGDVVFVNGIGVNYEKLYNLKELGASMPVLSPDMNYIAFTSKSGKIWRMSIQDTISEFIDITPGDTTELNIFAGWSPNGKYIIFNRYFTDITQQQLSALCLAEVVDGKPLITLLSNNVYRGYWSRISN